MFATAAVVWAAVVGLALVAMRRGRPLAPATGLRLIAVCGGVVPALLLAALLAYGTLTSDRVTGRGAEVDHVVRVTARQWRWDFEHLDADGGTIAATTDRLALPVGRMVEFRIDSVDVIHSFWIPRLGGKMDAIPGRTNVLRLRADRPGPMRGQCAEFCGLEHALMGFEVVVLEADAFAAWLDAHAVAGGGP